MPKSIIHQSESTSDILAKLKNGKVSFENVSQSEILQRLEALEQSNDIIRQNMGLIKEILETMNDIPLFRLVLKRAINRQSLNSVQFGILPRRKRYLRTIQRMKGVPTEIRQTFIDGQKTLIQQAVNIIRHRRNFDQQIKKQIEHSIPYKHFK